MWTGLKKQDGGQKLARFNQLQITLTSSLKIVLKKFLKKIIAKSVNLFILISFYQKITEKPPKKHFNVNSEPKQLGRRKILGFRPRFHLPS